MDASHNSLAGQFRFVGILIIGGSDAVLMTEVIPLRTIVGRGIVAVVLSLVVNWTLLFGALAVDLVEPFGALSASPVTFLTVLGVGAATAVYGAVTRLSPSPDWVFVRLAIVALLISFIPDIVVLLYDAEATFGAVVVLMLMHVAVALICVGVLTQRYRPRIRSSQ